MKHFTYEIDERNLRVTLKDLEIPLKEGVWENFDEFSLRNYKHIPESGFRLKLVLNRNVLTLGFFGFVIISFSLLLVNFISIKNPKKESAQTLEEDKTMTIPALKPAAVKMQLVVSKPETIVTTPIAKNAALITEVKTQQSQTLASVVPQPVSLNPSVQTSGVKPQMIQAAAVKSQGPLASELRPTVITEDTEPDLRPD